MMSKLKKIYQKLKKNLYPIRQVVKIRGFTVSVQAMNVKGGCQNPPTSPVMI